MGADADRHMIADTAIVLARILRREDVTGDLRRQIVDLRWKLHRLVDRDPRPSDYLGQRVENLGDPPHWNMNTNAEYAAPGLNVWSQLAWKLIQDLLSALEEAEIDAS